MKFSNSYFLQNKKKEKLFVKKLHKHEAEYHLGWCTTLSTSTWLPHFVLFLGSNGDIQCLSSIIKGSFFDEHYN